MSRRDKLHENYITSGWYYVLVNVSKKWHNMIYIFSDKRSLTALYLEFKELIKLSHGSEYYNLKLKWFPYNDRIFLIKGYINYIIRPRGLEWEYIFAFDLPTKNINYKYLNEYNDSWISKSNFEEGPLYQIVKVEEIYKTHKWYTFNEN